MQLGNWIAVFGILVTGFGILVSVLIARWQVVSQRQLALFQKDLSVGVVPPETWLWRWDKRYWIPAFVGLQIVTFIVSALFDSSPVTRMQIWETAFGMASAVYLLVQWNTSRLVDTLVRMSNLNAEMVKSVLVLQQTLFDRGLLSAEEYKQKRAAILEGL